MRLIMTYEELKTAFPENFTKEKTLHEALDATKYTYEKLVSDTKSLRSAVDDAANLKSMLLKHFENAIVGVKGQLALELVQRVFKALDAFEYATFRANSKMSTIAVNLEENIGPLQEISTTSRILNVDLHDFMLGLTQMEREFFESVYFDQNKTSKSQMSAKQFAWMDKICRKRVGVRFEECFFTKPTKPEDFDSDLE
jgi:hypothetical protein